MVTIIILIAALLSGCPGVVKSFCARNWNKVICCEKAKLYQVDFDKYGVALNQMNNDEIAKVV